MDAVTALAGGMFRPLAMTGAREETVGTRSDAEFDTLYAAESRRVLQTCRYLLGSDEAEDAAQEVFLRARQRFEQYDRERPFASWILGGREPSLHRPATASEPRDATVRCGGCRTGGGSGTPARSAYRAARA